MGEVNIFIFFSYFQFWSASCHQFRKCSRPWWAAVSFSRQSSLVWTFLFILDLWPRTWRFEYTFINDECYIWRFFFHYRNEWTSKRLALGWRHTLKMETILKRNKHLLVETHSISWTKINDPNIIHSKSNNLNK